MLFIFYPADESIENGILYNMHDGKMLINSVIRSQNVANILDCVDICDSTPCCESFNFKNGHDCELNWNNASFSLSDLKDGKGVRYYEKNRN